MRRLLFWESCAFEMKMKIFSVAIKYKSKKL